MKYGYAFQRQGGPMSWRNGPPPQNRAADAKSLGSLGGTVFSEPVITLPKPGAPEVIPNIGFGATMLEYPTGQVIASAPKPPPKPPVKRIAVPVGAAGNYVRTTSMSGLGCGGGGDCGCGCGGGRGPSIDIDLFSPTFLVSAAIGAAIFGYFMRRRSA